MHNYSSNNLSIANNYGDSGTVVDITVPNGTNENRCRSDDGYADEQILAWSLALMWSFILQILNTSKNCTFGRGTRQIRQKWSVGTDG